MLIFIVITSVGGSDDIEENEVPIEGWDKDSLEEKAEVHDVGNDVLLFEKQCDNDLSPLTPSFQYSGYESAQNIVYCYIYCFQFFL